MIDKANALHDNPVTGNLNYRSDVGNYVYDSYNPHAVTNAGDNIYVYGRNGNMTARVISDMLWEYTYDAENRLVQIDRDGLMVNRYIYDGDGNRVARLDEDNDGTIFVGNYYEATYYSNTIPDPPPPVVEGGNDLNAVVPSGISYYYAGSQRIAMRTGQGAYLLFSDHLGSSSVVIDASGQVVEEGYYMPWGGTRGDHEITSSDYGYTGQMREGDIYYYNARWYDPELGRFMQADTIVPMASQGTQAFDRYAYVNNNPLRYTDPTGHNFRNTNYGMTDGGGSEPLIPKPWYETDGKYTFRGSLYWGAPITGPISPSQESNVYDPSIISSNIFHQTGNWVSVFNDIAGMFIPAVYPEDRDNVFWEFILTVKEKEISINTFQLHTDIVGKKHYTYAILETTHANAEPDYFVILNDIYVEDIPHHTYKVEFHNTYTYKFTCPEAITLYVSLACGQCYSGNFSRRLFELKFK